MEIMKIETKNIEPEFIGVRQALALSGGLLCRTTLLRACYDKRIQSHIIRSRGVTRGRRAISVASLRSYIATGVEV
jgi:hypothetical protein